MKPGLAVVSGASRGIGAEFVRQLLARGWEVHAVSRHPEKLKALEKLKVSQQPKLVAHGIDLEAKDGPSGLSAVLEGRGVDLLINNAGVYVDESDSFECFDFADLRRSFEVNTLLAARVCQALLPNLRKAGAAKVAQITSLMGSIGDNAGGGSYAYRMSKAALNMFNKCFAIEHRDLVAIVLHPGWVKTDMGGSNAPVTPEASVAGMLKVIENAKPSDSGRFFDYEGDELPW